MSRAKKILAATLTVLLVAAVTSASIGCRMSTHPVQPSDLGTARSHADLEAVMMKPGPIQVETVVGADWEVDRSGLINLDHPKAQAAGLQDGPEPIQIFFHALRHPTRGLFIVDTGVEKALRDAPEEAAITGLVAQAMRLDRMTFRHDTAGWLAAQSQPLVGVLLTHLHLDHISGMPDVPRGTPVYAGPGETTDRAFLNLFVQPVIDDALAGHDPIREWRYERSNEGPFAGVLDVFGDGSLWALWVPGHTSGSTAYLARTPDGPVLFVGDACHTAWGWQHGVEPGSFSHDKPASADSLQRLKAFAEAHPGLQIRLGHQHMQDKVVARTAAQHL